MNQVIKVGPFEWRGPEDRGGECWDLALPEGLKMTHWALKNYGGEPNDSTGFSGWRLVSGGPFTRVGGWRSRDEAMIGVVPWLLDYLRNELARRIQEQATMKLALEELLRGWA
jgi:hypothetical protein